MMRRSGRVVAAVVLSLVIFLLYRGTLSPQQSSAAANEPVSRRAGRVEQLPLPKPGNDDVEMVVASMRHENTSWLNDYLLDWRKNIFVVDDPSAELTVVKNKGREAMVFLSYLVDRYDSLPGNIILHHAERFQWHNDHEDYDALPLLQRFRFDHLKKAGYVNLRCAWVLGCPAEIRPLLDDTPNVKGEPITAKHVYKDAFEELFPEFAVPAVIGVPCCSQFAVRREVILRRPREDYVRYRKWLLSTSLTDALSGRVLEYSWHIMFGKDSVYCVDAGECYCKTYGLCDLTCEKNACEGQYKLPPASTLPKHWPKLGWKGEDRHWAGLP